MTGLKSYIKRSLPFYRRVLKGIPKPKNFGYCPICEANTIFIEYDPVLRGSYRCLRCNSIPRYRAIINALNRFFPSWRDMVIHESSPGSVSSAYIQQHCKAYSTSQYFEDVEPGSSKKGIRCEDLTRMTFNNDSFDLFVTQDVFEHVFNPEQAFREICRVLKPGGAHIFTMPWYPELPITVKRADLINGEITHLLTPVYHKNPVSKEGSLVTNDWGLDFVSFIQQHSGMTTMIFLHENRRLGLDAKHLEVFISYKKN